MKELSNRKDIIVYKDEYAYCIAPSITITDEGDWLIAFCESLRRRRRMHPPSDPRYHNLLMRSKDQGETWEIPRVVPGYDWYGVETPGIARTSKGDILVSAYRRRFFPKEAAEKMEGLLGLVFKDPHPWAVAHDGTYVHRSEDGGYTWAGTSRVDTSPYISGHSPRGAVELEDGTLMLALGAASPLDGIPPHVLGNELDEEGRIKPGKAAAFIAQSKDRGKTWGNTVEVARDPKVSFIEPALLVLPKGKLICMLRTGEEGGYYLYQCNSCDDGRTWTKPKKTGMWGGTGHPAHLIRLMDGHVLCVYGRRRPLYGIRACISYDEGENWDIENELIIRSDLPNEDLGYPSSIQLDDGRIFTTYWGQDKDGVTCIWGSYYNV